MRATMFTRKKHFANISSFTPIIIYTHNLSVVCETQYKPCHPTFTDKKVLRPTFPRVSLTKMVQCPILNNSHAYPFCKTTPGTQLFSIGHCTIFCQWNLLKTVTKLFSQWKSGCTYKLPNSSRCRREPWSSGYGRRLMFWRSWVRIPAPYTGWKIFIYM